MEYGRGGRPRNVSWANCPAANASGEPVTDRRSRVISWVTASLATTVACTRRSGYALSAVAADSHATSTSVIGLARQARINPSARSVAVNASGAQPSMVTSPQSRRDLHEPQSPLWQLCGYGTPAASAASRMVPRVALRGIGHCCNVMVVIGLTPFQGARDADSY